MYMYVCMHICDGTLLSVLCTQVVFGERLRASAYNVSTTSHIHTHTPKHIHAYTNVTECKSVAIQTFIVALISNWLLVYIQTY